MIYKTLHDIPIKIYQRISETDDFSLLEYDSLSESISNSIKGKDNKKTDLKELEEIYESIKNYRFDKFGISKDFRELYYLNNDLIRCQIKELEGDESMGEKIKRFESQIEFILNQYNNNDNDLETVHARERRIVEKETNRDLDKMSAFDFYTDLKDIQDRYEKMELERQYKAVKHA
jgi:hypothetical protein